MDTRSKVGVAIAGTAVVAGATYLGKKAYDKKKKKSSEPASEMTAPENTEGEVSEATTEPTAEWSAKNTMMSPEIWAHQKTIIIFKKGVEIIHENQSKRKENQRFKI